MTSTTTQAPPHLTGVLLDLDQGAEPLTMAAAARLKCLRRDGRSPSPATMYRWCNRGLDGTRLETARVGGSLVTTAAACMRFVVRLSGHPTDAKQPTPGEIARQHAAAVKELQLAGI